MSAEPATGSGQAFDAIVLVAESEGRKLTKAERLSNPLLQRELAAEKAATIAAAERSVAKAERQLEQAKKNLAQAKKENA